MAAMPDFKSSVIDELTCSICLNPLTKPKNLNCSHTFCLECLRPMVKSSKIDCAICRAPTPIQGSVDNLPTNYIVQNIVEKLPIDSYSNTIPTDSYSNTIPTDSYSNTIPVSPSYVNIKGVEIDPKQSDGNKYNSDGVKVWKGQKGNYYCGRKGLYYCVKGCDGQCGPNNGCNCPSCKTLDSQERIPPWHPSVPDTQYNSDGVKIWKGERGNYYCGRKGLYSCSKGCDGTCGPKNGCNCPSCRRSDNIEGISSWHSQVKNSDSYVNSANAIVWKGERGNYYCGRKGLYSCSKGCDGQCGPTNGCNCTVCRQLDLKEGIPPWHPISSVTEYNSDGAKVWKGQRGNYYCGRKGFYTCSKGCDGTCGPNNGCNCPSCRKLDNIEGIGSWHSQVKNSDSYVNSANAIVWKGQKGNYYCGRRGLYSCSKGCDGQCGPTNGCNCPTCRQLDLKEGIPEWHLSPSLTQYNSDGIKVWKGQRGNYYCGRKGLYNCSKGCDGTCGPTNGCNCPSCRNLDLMERTAPWHSLPSFYF